MECHEAVVADVDDAVIVVERRAIERVADDLSPVLPSRVDVMVVVVVHASDVVGYGLRVVVINRTALVFGVHIFEDDIAYPSVVLEVEFHAEQHVLEVVNEIAAFLFHLPFFSFSVSVIVHQEKGGVVFEVFVDVESPAPCVAVVVESRHPTADLVSGDVLIGGLADVGASRNECVPHAFQSTFSFHGQHGAVALPLIGCSSEGGCHLKSEFERPWEEPVFVSDFEISGFAVIEHVVCVVVNLIGECVLPIVVGHLSVCDMSFQPQPAVGVWNHPIFGE